MSIKHNISIGLLTTFILLQVFTGYAQCNDSLVDRAIANSGLDALFIREFRIKQGDKKKKKKRKRAISVVKYNVRLHEGILYRFNIENDRHSLSKAILQLRKANLLYASTYNPENQQDIKSFDYQCLEDGQYQVLLSFLDGNKACAVGVLSVVINDSTITAALADSVKVENILYAGIDNYVDIASATNPNGKLKVSINRGTIDKEGGLYRIYVKEQGPVIIDVTALDSLGRITETFKTEFKVQNRSMPNVELLGSNGGIISKEKIMNSYAFLTVNNYKWSDSFQIKMFTVAESITSPGISTVSTNVLTTRQKMIIKKLKEGDTFYIKDIVVEDKNGQIYNLPPLGFIISEF